MKALIIYEKDQPPRFGEAADPVPEEGEVLVQLEASALNHRDVWINKGMYPGIQYPVIAGSDGAGRAGEREVVICPNFDWGPDPAYQSKSYHILGLKKAGTLAEYTAVPASNLYDKPAHLSMEQAAALPLAGLTAYRALFTRGAVKSTDRVLITGIGGGVALFAAQFALAAGAEVYATSSADDKLDKAMALGVRGGANYRQSDWPQRLRSQAGGFHLIIDSAGGPGFSELVKLAEPGARMVVYGGTRGEVPALSPQLIFWRQLSILGSTMGTDAEFGAMLAFVEKHRIQPVVDGVLPLSRGAEAFQRMERGEQFGKLALLNRE